MGLSNRLARLVSGVVGVAAGLTVGWTAAYAASDDSESTYFTMPNGVDYRNYSSIYNGSNPDFSSISTVLIRRTAGETAAFRLGARARAYWSGGALCQRTATRYNTEEAWFFAVGIAKEDHECGGYVYSQGFTEVWNGSDYRTVVAHRTINLLY